MNSAYLEHLMACMDVFTVLGFLLGARAACGEGQENRESHGGLCMSSCSLWLVLPPQNYPIHAENLGGIAKG